MFLNMAIRIRPGISGFMANALFVIQQAATGHSPFLASPMDAKDRLFAFKASHFWIIDQKGCALWHREELGLQFHPNCTEYIRQASKTTLDRQRDAEELRMLLPETDTLIYRPYVKPSIANAQSSDRNSSWQSEVKDPEHTLFARARAIQEVIADAAMDEARDTLQEETKFVKEATKAAYPTTEEVYQD